MSQESPRASNLEDHEEMVVLYFIVNEGKSTRFVDTQIWIFPLSSSRRSALSKGLAKKDPFSLWSSGIPFLLTLESKWDSLPNWRDQQMLIHYFLLLLGSLVYCGSASKGKAALSNVFFGHRLLFCLKTWVVLDSQLFSRPLPPSSLVNLIVPLEKLRPYPSVEIIPNQYIFKFQSNVSAQTSKIANYDYDYLGKR